MSAAANSEAYRAGCSMAWETYDTGVKAEIFSTELGADSQFTGYF